MSTLQVGFRRLLGRGTKVEVVPAPLPEPEPVPEPPAHVSADDVRIGYRLFLDRDVEEEHVDTLATYFPTLSDLRRYFIELPEFRCQLAPKRTPALRGTEPPMHVEDVRDEAALAPLFEHIRQTWQRFGETEPHWSVSTAKEYLQENIAENRERFYEGGKWDSDRLFGALARNGIDATGLRTCLELGCGVGRVTLWLAGRFEHVIGYDISEAHLRIAGEEMEGRGAGNVEFRHLARPDDIRDWPKVDAAFTVVVLQHNPPPVIVRLIEGMIRALNPGGVAFFQVPTYRIGYRFDLAEYLAGEGTSQTMEMHVLPQEVVFEIAHREGARVVEVIEDGYTLFRDGELSSTFLIQKR